MNATNGQKPGRGRPASHGTDTLKRAVKVLGKRYIDQRTIVGKALAAWRSELLDDLGGSRRTSPRKSWRPEVQRHRREKRVWAGLSGGWGRASSFGSLPVPARK